MQVWGGGSRGGREPSPAASGEEEEKEMMMNKWTPYISSLPPHLVLKTAPQIEGVRWMERKGVREEGDEEESCGDQNWAAMLGRERKSITAASSSSAPSPSLFPLPLA
eukprot:2825443-Rhodomonas_salina.1